MAYKNPFRKYCTCNPKMRCPCVEYITHGVCSAGVYTEENFSKEEQINAEEM